MIDLHAHTTASDGASAPEALVAEAAAVGITTLAVTDHDTVAGIRAVQDAARSAGIDIVPGIEVTAVYRGRDVHVLGYFIDVADPALGRFLASQRVDRTRRVVEMAEKLEAAGMPIDIGPVLARAAQGTGRAVGRPHVAAALIARGHARDMDDAFTRLLNPGGPAFVERRGATPAEVIRHIANAGGVSSLAHPGKTRIDDQIPSLAADGLSAIEVFHPDHDDEAAARYVSMASALNLLVTAGSDYHGPGSGRAAAFGRIALPPEAYRALVARAGGGRT